MLKTPEEWLEQTAPSVKKEGVLKLFLGYAPGVGKTYTMLSEAVRRRRRGEDVMIGIVETHGRGAIVELASSLEAVPLRRIDYKGIGFDEMDVDAILARHPQVVLVDELAHTNIEGSKHRKRYEDVMEILAAKIDVLSTMNVQHVASLAPLVQTITGVPIRETVPDWVLNRAEEVVMIDLTPEALQTRLRRGDIYPTQRAERALAGFFRAGNLNALRELALRHVADSVDRALTSYLETRDITRSWGVRERIAVCISSNRGSQYLIARAARLARAIDGELYAVHVDTGEDGTDAARRKALADNIRFARNLNATVERLEGRTVGEALARFTRERRITQVVMGHSAPHGWRQYLYLWSLHRFLHDARAVDVHIVTQEAESEP